MVHFSYYLRDINAFQISAKTSNSMLDSFFIHVESESYESKVMFTNLWKRTKEVASKYTKIFIAIMILNQLLFFGFCLNPICLVAAMPHVLAITLAIGLFWDKISGKAPEKNNNVFDSHKPTDNSPEMEAAPYQKKGGQAWEPLETADEPESLSLDLTPVIKLNEDLHSTTALGKILGISARPFLFEELIRLGFIGRNTGGYFLTESGKSEGVGGKYRFGDNGKKWPVWPTSVGEMLLPIKQSFLADTQFKLYHMTHVENLVGIFMEGLLPHNSSNNSVDISNKDVNFRRSKKDTVHHQPLHDYVPMYFNPRNAMLFEKQIELGDDLVVLEIDKSIIMKNRTIFTDRNAAAIQCKFMYCISQMEGTDWDKINSREWTEGSVTNIDIKQAMMAECLVYKHVPLEFITKIHIHGDYLSDDLKRGLKIWTSNSVKPQLGSGVFFPPKG